MGGTWVTIFWCGQNKSRVTHFTLFLFLLIHHPFLQRYLVFVYTFPGLNYGHIMLSFLSGSDVLKDSHNSASRLGLLSFDASIKKRMLIEIAAESIFSDQWPRPKLPSLAAI